MENFRSFVSTKIYSAGAGIITLMSISDGLGKYIFRQNMEKTRSLREVMVGKVFIFRQKWHFLPWNQHD